MSLQNAQKKLLKWYETHGRHDLAWRNTADIYHIYLSEIMLQQTQVSRVHEEYYPNFLAKFPTLQKLAQASQEEVIAAWSGLGYYSRARNLHKCAQEANGELPSTQEELRKLPGIGRYTASAICSFGHNQNIPVVDTNIGRVIKRFFALVDAKEGDVWKEAERFVNAKAPRSHNLSLMDLGAMVCLPKSPKCTLCPLQSFCRGKNEPELYTQTKKTEYENLELFLGIYIKEDKIALLRSTEKMYKDMLVLPEVDPIEELFIGQFKHAYTKYRITVNLYNIKNLQGEFIWINVNELHKAPISSLTKKAQKFFL